MKVGTRGFVGRRLTEAREARGWTMIALAEKIGVSRQAISQFESGPETPRPEILERICNALDMPELYFLDAHPDEEPSPKFFRSLSAATKHNRLMVARRQTWMTRLTSFVYRFAEMPDVKFPTLDINEDPATMTRDRVECLATSVRRFWGLGDGPISNILWLLENNGAVVSCIELSDDIDSISGWSTGRPYVLLVSDKGSASRFRYDAAHELGHLVMHRHVDSRYANKSDVLNALEERAHWFAAAFTFPRSAFSLEAVPSTLDRFLSIKSRWGLSIKMMIKRASDLGFINDGHARRLYIERVKRGWDPCEPLDDVIEPERPRMLRRTIDMILQSGTQSREDLLASVALSERDVERLAGLPNMYLRKDSADVVELHTPRLRENPDTQPPASNHERPPAKVLDLFQARRTPPKR